MSQELLSAPDLNPQSRGVVTQTLWQIAKKEKKNPKQTKPNPNKNRQPKYVLNKYSGMVLTEKTLLG